MRDKGSKFRMRFSEKGVLASLALLLLAFSVIAQTTIFEAKGTASAVSSWTGEVGFYLPFVLFALVSTYHFLEWAKRHKRQAIILMLFIVGIASVIGSATVNAPRPVLNSLTLQSHSPTQQGEGSIIQIQQQPPSLQESLLKLREVLSQTPYFSTGFDAIVLAASGLALLVVLLKMRREKSGHEVKPLISPIVTEVQAKTPREIVIRAYQMASHSLQRGGLEIPDSDTPADAVMRITQAEPTLADAFRKLTLLFEEAKFSLHPMNETHAHHALDYCKTVSGSGVGSIQQ